MDKLAFTEICLLRELTQKEMLRAEGSGRLFVLAHLHKKLAKIEQQMIQEAMDD